MSIPKNKTLLDKLDINNLSCLYNGPIGVFNLSNVSAGGFTFTDISGAFDVYKDNDTVKIRNISAWVNAPTGIEIDKWFRLQLDSSGDNYTVTLDTTAYNSVDSTKPGLWVCLYYHKETYYGGYSVSKYSFAFACVDCIGTACSNFQQMPNEERN